MPTATVAELDVLAEQYATLGDAHIGPDRQHYYDLAATAHEEAAAILRAATT